MLRLRVVFILLTLAAFGMAAEEPAGPTAGDAVYTVTLERALDGDLPLTLQLRAKGGTFIQAWGARAGDENRPLPVDASELRIEGPRVRGTLRATAGSVQYALDLDARPEGATLSGRYSGTAGATERGEIAGTVTGNVAPAPRGAAAVRCELALGKVVTGGNNAQCAVSVAFTLRGGALQDATLRHDGAAQSWEAKIAAAELTFTGDALTGTLTIEPTALKCPVWPGRYEVKLDATVVGTALAGRASSFYRGERGDRTVVEGTPFSGTVSVAGAAPPAAAAADAVYVLELDKGLDGEGPLRLLVERRAGALRAGRAWAPTRANAPHAVDVSGLTLADGKLAGVVDLRINPAGWGAGAQPIAYRYHLAATVRDGAVAGTFTGRHVPLPRSGTARGTLQTWEALRAECAVRPGLDYATWRGPSANGACAPSGHTLVDTLQEARLVWRSQEPVPDAWIWSRSRAPLVAGGFSSPVLADGRLFVGYYLPAGDVQGSVMTKTGDGAAGRTPPQRLVEADDVVLCVDPRTGETLWKTVYPKAGLNWNYGQAGPTMTPCAAGGKVYVIGSAGRVYGLDAATGATAWTGTLGAETERAAGLLAAGVRTKSMVNLNRDFCSAPLVVGDILVCNDNAKGLLGLDPATGRRVWGSVPDCLLQTACPAPWVKDGKTHLVTASDHLTCLDPVDGRVLWTGDKGATTEGTPAISGDYLVTNGSGKGASGLSCFRLALTGAALLWSAGGKYSQHVTSPAIYQGWAYGFSGDETCAFELETGKTVAMASCGNRSCSSFIAANGKLIRSHLYNQLFYYDADPAHFRQLGPVWFTPPFGENTSPIVVDGRMFFRGKDCLWCYDLRKSKR